MSRAGDRDPSQAGHEAGQAAGFGRGHEADSAAQDAHAGGWARRLDGDGLPPHERRALAEALRADPDLRRDLLDDAELDGVLRALGRSERDEPGFLGAVLRRLDAEADAGRFVAAVEERVRPAPPRHRGASLTRLALGAGSAVACAATILFLVTRPARSPAPTPASLVAVAPRPPGAASSPRAAGEALATLEAARGAIALIDRGRQQPVAAGAALVSGQGLATGADGGGRLRFADGTTIELEPDTLVAQVGEALGKRLFVAAGRVSATVAAQPAGRPLVLGSPHLEATVVGTRLRLAVDPGGSRLDVTEGRVLLARGPAGAPPPGAGAEGETLVVAGQHALVSAAAGLRVVETPRGGVALFIALGAPLWKQDDLVSARLQRLGLEVRQFVPGAPGLLEAVREASIVLVSATIAAKELDVSALRELPVPLMVWEPFLYDRLGMTDACTTGACGEEPAAQEGLPYPLFITNPQHALAGGLTGTLRVAGRGAMSWGTPSPNAAWVAIRSGEPARALIFGYERGAEMPGLVAPARRVGFFMQNATPRTLTPAGWSLFDAAVGWCLADAR